jgi:hypothetical protein
LSYLSRVAALFIHTDDIWAIPTLMVDDVIGALYLSS